MSPQDDRFGVVGAPTPTPKSKDGKKESNRTRRPSYASDRTASINQRLAVSMGRIKASLDKRAKIAEVAKANAERKQSAGPQEPTISAETRQAADAALAWKAKPKKDKEKDKKGDKTTGAKPSATKPTSSGSRSEAVKKAWIKRRQNGSGGR